MGWAPLAQVLNGSEKESLNASTTHARARGQGTLDAFVQSSQNRNTLDDVAEEEEECFFSSPARRVRPTAQPLAETEAPSPPPGTLPEEDCFFASPAKRVRRSGAFAAAAQSRVEVPRKDIYNTAS